MKKSLIVKSLLVATVAMGVVGSALSQADELSEAVVKNHIPIRYEGFEVILDCRERAPIFFHYSPRYDSADYDRAESFSIDPNIPKECQQTSTNTYRVPYSVYVNSGKSISYHRGHLVTANHMDFSPTAIDMTNFMTNIVPMTATVNADGAWRETEIMTECLRDRLVADPTKEDNTKKSFDVMGGVIWGNDESNDYFVNTHGVRTPDYLWKVLYDPHAEFNNQPSVIAWIIPNDNKAIKENLPKYRVTVKDIESKIGFALPIKSEMKKVDDYPLWETPKYCGRS